MRAVAVDHIRSEAGQAAGAIEFRLQYWPEDGGIAFRCPCGCGLEGYLPIRPAGSPRRDTPEWEWDGNRDAPTLQPSVLQLNGCRWHGFLTVGEWRTA